MRKILSLIAALAVSAVTYAQGALSFIQEEHNPAAAGLAGSAYASTSLGTAYSAFGNPAAQPLASNRFDASLSYRGFSSVHNINAGVAMRFGKFGISAGFFTGLYPEVQGASDGGGTLSPFKPTASLFGLGLSLGIGEHIGLGANVRYGIQQLDKTTALNAINFDVMAMFKTGGLGITAGVVGLGPNVKSVSNSTYPLPSSARLGVDYALPLGPVALEAVAGFDYYFSGNIGAGLGVQVGYNDLAFARVGFRYGSKKEDFNAAPVPTHLSLGLGGKLFGIRLDVAYQLLLEGQGGMLSAGLSYSF